MRAEPTDAARAFVSAYFPDACQAWLGGSAATGTATATSDLDITVLLDVAEVRRESHTFQGWPVEVFVHTDDSLRFFVDKDQARRRPTMARLIATGMQLIDGGGGETLQRACDDVLATGPMPPLAEDVTLARYLLTDLLDDLAGGGTATEQTAVAVDVWRQTTELALDALGGWHGSGKWMARELAVIDEQRGTTFGPDLAAALQQALAGDTGPLAAVADHVLALVGGRLREGYRQVAELPDTAS